MLIADKKYAILFGIIFLLCFNTGYAGPPFNTDDPEPVDYKHWEFYISSMNIYQSSNWQGTSPHVEVNYGIIQNVQVHVLLPYNYNYTVNHNTTFGYAYSEVGIKYRFIKETDNTPQIGVFPIVELPTIKNNEFGNGKTQIYLPLWIQKSYGKLTTYGGAGYWINPGTNNKNWVFAGWELQYDISKTFTLGGELYYHSIDAIGNKPVTAFNVGGYVNATKKFHIIFSLGHNIINTNFTSSYLGLLWTI